MMDWLSKRKWIALCMVAILLFTLLPTNLNWADKAVGIQEAESTEKTAEDMTTEKETASTTEAETAVSTEAEQSVTEAGTEVEEGGSLPDETTEASTAADIQTSEVQTEISDTTEGEDLVEPSSDSDKPDKVAAGNEKSAASGILLENDTFNLTNLTLEASYVDENNVTQNVALNTTDKVKLPVDADINMYFNFIFYDGDEIVVGKEYVYNIPQDIRVDVDATHPLTTVDGTSIGTVHITRDGKLTFVFNDSVVGQSNIPFYVRFEGGFSADSEEDLGERKISFPTAGGSFDYMVDVTGSNKGTESDEPGDLGVSKSGTKTYINVNGESVPVIQWSVSLNLNGRDSLTADITDMLPEGLTYAKVDGYPQLSGGSKGSVSCNSADGDKSVSIHVEGADSYYRTNVTFYTYYGNEIFDGTTISNNSGVNVENTVVVDEEGSVTSVPGTGNCYVTPNVLSKSGSENGGVITWTVTINRDKLNVGGTTYTDTFGSGYSWAAGQNVTVQPAGTGTVSTQNGGFTFTANAGVTDTITLTYQTKIDDYTMSRYTNTGELKNNGFDASVTGTVNGYNLISKTNTSYNEVTKQLSWRVAVNEQRYDFAGKEVKVTDIYNVPDRWQNKMELVSMNVTDANGNILTGDWTIDESAGSVTFPSFGSETRYITVVTKILDEAGQQMLASGQNKWKDGDWVTAYNRASLTWDGNSVTADASKGFQYKTPELITKNGTLNGDGTIEWVIYFTYQNLTQESIHITDTLPEGLEYVAGSMEIMENTWTNGTKVKQEPSVSGNNMSLTIDNTSSKALQYYLDRNFEIHYKTKQKKLEDANTHKTYTNNATATVNYEGDVEVTDTATKTVEGEVGGTLGKEAAYQNGNDYVDWTVTINEGGYTMNVKNPVIRDHLESYFDYVENSAKLYRVKNGTRTEVTNFSVSVINNDMVVSLPDIVDETYEFTFRTKFNVTAAKLINETIKNTVEFEGDAYQESVTSNEVKNVSFSSSSAGAYFEKELRIKKVDKQGNALAGATFALYHNGNYVTTVTTGADGYAVFKGVNSSAAGYSYVLKETTPPDGYEKKDEDIEVVITDAKLLTENTGVRYYEESVTNTSINEEVSTAFSVYKTGEKNAALSGAGFTVYSDAACTTPVAVKTTGADGLISFTVKYSKNEETNYYVKETTVPDGYKSAGTNTVYQVTIDTDGQITCKNLDTNAVVNMDTINGYDNVISLTNAKAKGSLVLTKVEAGNSSTHVRGAVYTLYADVQCSDEVDTKTTDANGKIEFTGLTLGHTYYYRETSAPAGYLLDETVHSITIGTGKEHEDVSASTTVEDEKALGYIQVTKTDDTAKANRLAKVVFRLYKEDGTTPYPSSSSQATATTDSSGVAIFQNIPFGTYVVKEASAPDGYIVNTTGTTVTVDTTTGSKITVVNEVIQFSIRVIKQDDSGNLLSGVYFTVKNTATGAVVAGGETGADGTITFNNLTYGSYTVTETKGLPGYTVDSTPQYITPGEIANDGIIEKTFVNDKQSATIKFRKRDGDDQNVYLAGAEFSVYNSSGELVQTVVSSDDVSALGEVVIKDLIYDTYTIKETKAPNKYQLDATEWKVTVDKNDTYALDYGLLAEKGEAYVDNTKLPSAIKYMSFKVKKVDQSGTPLAGAKFNLLRKYKGEAYKVISTAYSDEDGIVEFYNIAIADDPDTTLYRVEEAEPPAGYDRGKVYYKEYTYAELPAATYAGTVIGHIEMLDSFENVPTIYTYQNTQILGAIRVTKTGTGTNNKLSGAEFTLYKYNAVNSKYEVYKDKDNRDYVVTTDTTGTAIFKDLPYGTYMVKETKAPKGYVLNAANEKKVVIGAETFPDNNQAAIQMNFVDTAINVSVNKFAVGGSSQVSGAVLELYEAGDTNLKNCLQRWTTTNNAQKLTHNNLEVGKTYFIHEKSAPNGYVMSEDVYFTINSNGSITYVSGANGSVSGNNVIMRDASITLRILKQGLDTTTGTRANLAGAAISLIDDATGKKVYSFTSTTTAQVIPSDKLSVPASGYRYYTVHEDSAPGGYALTADIRIAIDSDGKVYSVNEDGTVGTELTDKIVTMTDEAYVNFYFAKRDAVTGEALAGASFTIKDNTGAIREQWVSTNTPKNVQLEPGEGYIFTEESAPAGYELEDPITFNVVQGTPNYIQIVKGNDYNLSVNSLTLTSHDAPITVRFVKWSDQYQPLAGGTFELHESNANGTIGKLLDTFESTGSTMTLGNQNFKLGGYYVIVEKKAPENYNIAEPVYFHIREDGRAEDLDGNLIDNNLVIFIDGEKQVSFQKVDAATGNPVAGVQLRIISSEDEDFTVQNWTTDGTAKYFGYSMFKRNVTYTLVEAATVNGYTYAASIHFKIDDNGIVYVNNKAQQTSSIVMKNSPFSVTVEKYVLGTSTQLAGATLQVADSNGTVLEQWVSDGKPHALDTKKLHVSPYGNEYVYTLSEIKAPELYALAQPIQFVIDKNGMVKRVDGEKVTDNTIKLYDEFRGITFHKQNEDGKELSGATITITSTQDSDFTPISWVSTKTPKNLAIDLFKRNTDYIMTETTAPNGYVYTDSIVFRIDEKDVLYVNGSAVADRIVTMVDKAIRLKVSKKIAGTKEFLSGAKLSIVDEATGKVVYSWKSKQKAVRIPANKLVTSTDTQQVIYVLKETEAPDGYELAEDIRFYIGKNGKVYILDGKSSTESKNNTITMYDEKTDESRQTTSKKTGDTSPLRPVAIMFLLSLAGCGMALAVRRRRRR